MSIISESEKKMWEKPAKPKPIKLTIEEINAKYTSREWRIVTADKPRVATQFRGVT